MTAALRPTVPAKISTHLPTPLGGSPLPGSRDRILEADLLRSVDLPLAASPFRPRRLDLLLARFSEPPKGSLALGCRCICRPPVETSRGEEPEVTIGEDTEGDDEHAEPEPNKGGPPSHPAALSTTG